MPNSTLSALPAAATLDGQELYYTVQNGLDRKVQGLVSKRILLTADTTYYVSTTGTDTLSGGTAAAPWATLQYAMHFIEERVDFAGWTITLQLAAGAGGNPTVYNGFETLGLVGGGNLYIESSDGDPTHTTITSATQAAIRLFLNATTRIAIGGVTLQTTGGIEPIIYLVGDFSFSLGTVNCPNIVIGPIATALTFLFVAQDHVTVEDTAVNAATSVTLAPGGTGCSGFLSVSFHAKAVMLASYTISGGPVWGVAFINVLWNATANVHFEVGVNVTGASTGPRFYCERLASFRSSGTLSSFPGDADGISLNSNVLDGSSLDYFTVVYTPVAVSTLPTPSATYNGARRMVSDASSPTFGAVVAGSSSTVVPVYCDGTNWRVG